MRSLLLIPILIIICIQSSYGQQIKGFVADRGSRLKLSDVDVINQTMKERTRTNSKGLFVIKAELNNILIFNLPGYFSDTLFLTNLNDVRKYLILNTTFLKTIEIKQKAFDPEVEYATIYKRAKAINTLKNQPFIFYPSKYFSKEGKYARRFKRKMEREKIERKIDYRFNELTVKKVVPLTGPELDYFMVLYRPGLAQLDKMDQDDFMLYLMNCYKKFKDLPAEARISPSLKSTN